MRCVRAAWCVQSSELCSGGQWAAFTGHSTRSASNLASFGRGIITRSSSGGALWRGCHHFWVSTRVSCCVSCRPPWCCAAMLFHLVSSFKRDITGTRWLDNCCCCSRLHVLMLEQCKEYFRPFFSIVFCFWLLCLLLLTWHLTSSGHFYLVKVIVLQQSHSKQGMTEFKREQFRKKCITAMAYPGSFHRNWKLSTVSNSPTRTPVCFRDILMHEFLAMCSVHLGPRAVLLFLLSQRCYTAVISWVWKCSRKPLWYYYSAGHSNYSADRATNLACCISSQQGRASVHWTGLEVALHACRYPFWTWRTRRNAVRAMLHPSCISQLGNLHFLFPEGWFNLKPCPSEQREA